MFYTFLKRVLGRLGRIFANISCIFTYKNVLILLFHTLKIDF